EHIEVSEMHKNDKDTFSKDYVVTPKFIDFDIEKLDSHIESIFGKQDYSLLAHFNKENEIVISYRDRKSNEYKEYEFSLTNDPNEVIKNLILVVNSMMIEVRTAVFEEQSA
ncbi:hypothetical protein, partial [Niastella populi]|uniref:hypothetical protein n=1 Tax=Niastella populi TaxID=550983 RepID=UPI0013FDF3DE